MAAGPSPNSATCMKCKKISPTRCGQSSRICCLQLQKTLLNRCIQSENLPAAEDIKKAERRLVATENKSLKKPDALYRAIDTWPRNLPRKLLPK
ncbi:hypothetical protein CNECB9_560034 [Cupriavidus necator]|uniref:Uncharacterized protein n=1 Tax=Cupriavidus necator TaxID=106590 RepID=A0A1K0JPX4_CUPNE|nr:hypothetical protein CNECB9_560034 [Cupriavidus necator]